MKNIWICNAHSISKPECYSQVLLTILNVCIVNHLNDKHGWHTTNENCACKMWRMKWNVDESNQWSIATYFWKMGSVHVYHTIDINSNYGGAFRSITTVFDDSSFLLQNPIQSDEKWKNMWEIQISKENQIKVYVVDSCNNNTISSGWSFFHSTHTI